MRETNYNYHQIVRIAIIAITLFIQYSCIDGENGNHNNNNNKKKMEKVVTSLSLQYQYFHILNL